LQPTRHTFADFVVIVSLVIAGLYLLVSGKTSASTVTISTTEGEVLKLSLNDDRLVEIEGRLGKSVIEIKDGKVRFVDSPCPHHLCMRRGWIHEGGDWVACAPNGIMVSISGDAKFDAITP